MEQRRGCPPRIVQIDGEQLIIPPTSVYNHPSGTPPAGVLLLHAEQCALVKVVQ